MSGFAAELPGGVLAPKLTEEVFSRPFRRKAVAAVSSLSRTRDPHVAATKHICGDGAGSVDSRARAFGQPASAAESETRERSTATLWSRKSCFLSSVEQSSSYDKAQNAYRVMLACPRHH